MDGKWIPDFSLSSESFTYSADESLLDGYEEFWIYIYIYFILFACTRIKNYQRRRLKWAVSIKPILFGFYFLLYFFNGFPLELWFTYWTSVWTSPNRSDIMSGSIPSLKYSHAEFWLEASSDSLKIIWGACPCKAMVKSERYIQILKTVRHSGRSWNKQEQSRLTLVLILRMTCFVRVW